MDEAQDILNSDMRETHNERIREEESEARDRFTEE